MGERVGEDERLGVGGAAGRAVEVDDRGDVDGADARVLAGVARQVDAGARE